MYHLSKNGVECIFRTSCKKMNLSLVSRGQMKMLVNAGKNFVLLMIKAKYIVDYEAFTSCDSKLKHEFNTYDKMFT